MRVIVNRAVAPFGGREAAIARFRCDLEGLLLPLLLGQNGLPQGHLLIGELFLQRRQLLRINRRRWRDIGIPGFTDKFHELLRHVLAGLHELHRRAKKCVVVVRSLMRHGCLFVLS